MFKVTLKKNRKNHIIIFFIKEILSVNSFLKIIAFVNNNHLDNIL